MSRGRGRVQSDPIGIPLPKKKSPLSIFEERYEENNEVQKIDVKKNRTKEFQFTFEEESAVLIQMNKPKHT